MHAHAPSFPEAEIGLENISLPTLQGFPSNSLRHPQRQYGTNVFDGSRSCLFLVALSKFRRGASHCRLGHECGPHRNTVARCGLAYSTRFMWPSVQFSPSGTGQLRSGTGERLSQIPRTRGFFLSNLPDDQTWEG